MKIQPFKRIISEDYDKQFRTIAEKMGSSINLFADDVYNALNQSLSIEDNFNQVKKTISVTVNSSGTPISTTSFKSGLSTNCYGINVLKATNTTSSSTYPTTSPFISFSESNNIITIKNITGLQANNTYSLNLLIYP